MKFTNKLERKQSDQRHNMLWIGMFIREPKPKTNLKAYPKANPRDERVLNKEEWK